MIKNPQRYIENFVRAGADLITIHYESTSRPKDALLKIKSHNHLKAGLAISPDTPYDVVIPYLDMVDMILVMTVEPGFGGQKFMHDMMPKVSALRKAVEEGGYNVEIEVDGGIGAETAAIAAAAGANVLVAGSSVFGAADAEKAVAEMREAEEKAYKY
jgi:ribulose-phosphate 3-epimerase